MADVGRSQSPPRLLPPLPRSAPLAARTLRWALRVLHALWVHDAIDAARSMAFNFFLSLVPLLLLVGFVVGVFVRQRGVDALVEPFIDAVPATAAGILRHELERMAGASVASLAPLSIAGFLWLTSSGTHHMMDVLEGAVQAPKRSWWKQRAIALASVVLGLATMCATAWVLVTADSWVHRHDNAPAGTTPASTVDLPGASAPGSSPTPSPTPATTTRLSRDRERSSPLRRERKLLFVRRHAGWENAVAACLLLAVAVGGLAAFYRFAVEHPPGIQRRAWPGAVTAMVAWLGVSWGFGSYATSLAQYALFYGSLAAVAVLLVWLYLTSLSLLLGAEVNAQLEGVRDLR